MTKRIGILTSGGDCAGLNAAIRAVALARASRLRLDDDRHRATARWACWNVPSKP